LWTGIVDFSSVFGEIIVARVFSIFKFGALFSFPLQLCVVVIGEATNSYKIFLVKFVGPSILIRCPRMAVLSHRKLATTGAFHDN
jgi:hypothetical protein